MITGDGEEKLDLRYIPKSIFIIWWLTGSMGKTVSMDDIHMPVQEPEGMGRLKKGSLRWQNSFWREDKFYFRRGNSAIPVGHRGGCACCCLSSLDFGK